MIGVKESDEAKEQFSKVISNLTIQSKIFWKVCVIIFLVNVSS